MRPRERQAIRRALVLVRSGDRAAAIECLRVLMSPPPSPVLTTQLALPILLSLTVRCDRLQVDAMRVGDCLHRRSRVWPSGNGKGSPAPEATPCAGCPIGEALSRQLPDYIPAPSTIPRAVRG